MADDVPVERDATAARLADRNRRIVESHAAGESMAEIGRQHGLSTERIRQLVRRSEGRPAARRRRGRAVSEGERVRLRIGNLAKAVLVTGQAYQDPKDALNEFVSNAADDYAEAGVDGARIRIMLRRKGARAVIAVDDSGRGMGPDRLREVARNLFESSKANDARTLGEKAIGLLAFQQLGARCDVVSRAADGDGTWTLRLRRGEASAELLRERRRARSSSGTTVFISELDAEAVRVLTRRKVVDYLRRRRGQAIAAGAYSIEVVEGRAGELVTPDEPSVLPIPIRTRDTLWGKFEFALYVSANVDTTRRRVAVVGRAGTTIIDDLGELEEFDRDPWTSGQVSGRVSFEPLRQSAGRRAILRDDEIYPVFREVVQSVEPLIVKSIERVREELDIATADRMSDALRQVFGRVLKELADLENPMRTLLGDEPGTGADAGERATSPGPSPDDRPDDPTAGAPPSVDEFDIRPTDSPPDDPPTGSASSAGARQRHLPSVAPDPHPGHRRSRFDADGGIVLYNDEHADFLLVKNDETMLLDYLATLVAKEYVVYNNPRADPEELAEELVRMLIRVRRHLPAKARRR